MNLKFLYVIKEVYFMSFKELN